jgi:hypothetical protein
MKKVALIVGVLALSLLLLALVARKTSPPSPTPEPGAAQFLDDLSMPIEPLLRAQPEVLDVQALVRTARPALRIIHLRSWHFVPQRLHSRLARRREESALRRRGGRPVRRAP